MTAAADYSFNKSHAACYALISYRTAYLKANYPAEYMAAVISSVMSTKDKVPFFVNRCKEMGIEVLPPDVNSSDHGFVVSRQLDPVRARRGQERRPRGRRDDHRGPGGRRPFDSIWDFCERADARAVNKRAIECLIKCGALDSTGDSRRGMLEVLSAAQSAGQKAQEDARRGQGSIFDLGGDAGDGRGARAGARSARIRRSRRRSSTSASCCGWRRRRSGRSSRRIRSARSATRFGRGSIARCGRGGQADGAWVTVGGIVSEARRSARASGGYVMFATLDDLEGRLELFVRDAAGEAAEQIELDRVVLVRGRVDKGAAARLSLVVAEAERVRARRRGARRGRGQGQGGRRAARARIDAAAFGPRLVDELKSLFERLPGRQRGAARDGDPRGHPPAALRRPTTASLPPRPCAPSSTNCSARVRWRPERARLSPCRSPSAGESGAAVGECRRAARSAIKLIEPRGCIELAAATSTATSTRSRGGSYMGCMRKVFRAEIDLDDVRARRGAPAASAESR